MDLFHAFLFGLVQGIAEYLPISSSAHLILLPRFLEITEPGLTFDVFLHIGTLFATLGFFWRDWLGILTGQKASQGTKGGLTFKFLVIGTIPALVAGAGLHHWIESSFRGNAVLVVTLTLGGGLLFAFDRWSKGARGYSEITLRDVIVVGLFQCLALVPGMSRSGSTMMGGRLIGLDRATSARLSFLLSGPVTLAAIVFELRKWPELINSSIGIAPLLVAGVSSFLFGLFAIGGLIQLVKRFGYLSFAIYRIGLSIVIWKVLGI